MELVDGVEVSCTWGGATIHVLGYGFDVTAEPLVKALGDLHRARWSRAEEIGRRLEAKGMPGAFEGARAIQAELGDSENAPARPHFAEFLLRQGHVKDRAEAFRKWLGAGKLGDVKQHWPSLADASAPCARPAPGSASRTPTSTISPAPSGASWWRISSPPAAMRWKSATARSRPSRSAC